MKLLRRIIVTVVVTLTVIFVGVNWIAPVALSFYAARKAPAIAKVVPTDLKDHSLSQAPGVRLSYVGYAFDVPWSNLDESKTELYPKDKPDKTRAVLTFGSGLRMMVTVGPPRLFAAQFAHDFKMSPGEFEAVFGRGAATSDYAFVSNVYAFTPDKMHYWSFSDSVHYREDVMLMIKSIMPVNAAAAGIFQVQNQYFKGFQQGNPQVRKDNIVLSLYSDDGLVEFVLLQKANATGVTQPEINRIVQSVHKAPSEPVASVR